MPKSRRRGQDELCLPPLHGTQGGAVERSTPSAHHEWRERRVRITRQFLLQDDVSSGLSARRLDPRRRRAETGFAAGLNWDGVKRASARFSQVAFCVSPGPFFLKRIGKLRVVTSHDTTFGADGCPFKHLRLALGEFSEPRHTLKYSNVLLNFVFSVLALPSTASPKSTEINFRSNVRSPFLSSVLAVILDRES